MEIKQTNVVPQEMEIGGLQRLDIDSLQIGQIVKYKIVACEVRATEWGDRVDFTIQDDYGQWILSSWNIASKKRFKPSEILGKEFAFTKKNEKKLEIAL